MPAKRETEDEGGAGSPRSGAGDAAEEVKTRATAFLKAMYSAEESISVHRSDLKPEEWQACIRSILAWLDTTEELPKACLTRDIGREILAQLSAVVMISGYRGEPDAYIA